MLWQMCATIFLSNIAFTRGDIELLPEYDWDEDECPTPTTKYIQNAQVMWNSPHRAYETIPEDMILANSSIPNSGMGVFSQIFISKYTVLAEYEGDVVLKLDHISDYAWKVKRNGKKYFYIDAYDVATSNWLRWINCARHSKEENVEVMQCKGKMFYITNKDIYPGEELLIYYGDGYAENLGIDPTRFYDESYFLELLSDSMSP